MKRFPFTSQPADSMHDKTIFSLSVRTIISPFFFDRLSINCKRVMKLFQIELECVINVETFTTLSVISLTLLLCPERKKFLVKLHSHLQQQSLTFDTNDLTEVGHFSGCLVVDSLPSPQTTQTEDQKWWISPPPHGRMLIYFCSVWFSRIYIEFLNKLPVMRVTEREFISVENWCCLHEPIFFLFSPSFP